LTPGTWSEYYGAANQVVVTVGRKQQVSSLQPADFGKLRTAVARRLGPVALHKFITMARTLFGFAWSERLIPAPIWYRDRFDKPEKKHLQAARNARPKKMIAAEDFWRPVDYAGTQFRGMLWLGLNCGFGANDCSQLPRSALDVEPGWVVFPRPKTEINRRCPLWPETIAALEAVRQMRPASAKSEDNSAVFLTRNGLRWVQHIDHKGKKAGTNVDAVLGEFAKVADRAGVETPGGFLDLRGISANCANHIQESEAITGPNYFLVTDLAELATVSSAVEESSSVGLDLETTGLDPRADRIRLLSVSVDTVDGGRFAYLVDCNRLDPSPLFPALTGATLVGHNLAFDLGFLARLGFRPGKAVRDTMLLSQVLYAATHTKGTAFIKHGLKDCFERELALKLDKDQQDSVWSGSLSPQQLAYAANDVDVLAPLHAALTAKLTDAGLQQAADLECRALPTVVWMAGQGVPFDRARWQALTATAAADSPRLAAELDSMAPEKPDGLFGGKWNWDSPEQVKQALALVGCPVESTADDVLAGLDNSLANLLRDYRDARKRETTYGLEWASKHVKADGRIYAKWSQLGATSGRMACGEPNMQNLPRGEYRKCFRAPTGRVLVKADYSQIELRIAAKVSGDDALLEAYQRGDDLHTLTAKHVLDIQEVTKQHRQLAKAVNFGLLYGMGAKAFRVYARTNYGVELTEAEAEQYREAFFRAYPGLRRWHRSMGKLPVDSRTLTGRRVLKVERFSEKLNMPVQGTGADGLKLALALLWDRRDEVPGAVPIMAVHDELVIEAPEEHGEKAKAWIKQAMLDAMTPLVAPVPVVIEVTVARTWGGD
jgi:DNA polymerase-1